MDKDKGKVRVLVNMFGRDTPVELDFNQVEKYINGKKLEIDHLKVVKFQRSVCSL